MARATQLINVDDLLAETDAEMSRDTTEPVVLENYLPAEGMGIHVPTSVCELIHDNILDTIKANEPVYIKWDRCFRQYRLCGNEGADDRDLDYNFHYENDTDENIIRTNIRTLMRTTYMQNPNVEFTATSNEMTPLVETLEYILKFLMNKRTTPGLNLKQRVRRWIMHGQLTNFGVIRLDYQPREGSRQEAVEVLQDLERKLGKVKKQSEAEEILAQLEIVHRDLPITQSKGMTLTNVLPQCLIVDPKCTMIDLSDADWVAEWFDEDRDYIEQKYYKEQKDGSRYLRINPKIKLQDKSEVVENVRESVTETIMSHKDEEKRELLGKDKVRCYYYYDRILRRCYLFSSEDWKHPLWVSEDDMGLSRFFRHFILSFGEPIEDIIQPGEVSFYVGMVKEINKINAKATNIRDNVFNNVVYNRAEVDSEEIKKLVRALRNPGEVEAFGISNKTDRKIQELLEVLAPPAVEYEQLFDTRNLRGAIDRIAATSAADRGEQFKANTTNDAVQFAAQIRQETTGIVVDTIEDAIDELAWSVVEIVVSKYSREEIAEMIGEERAASFTPMNVEEFNQRFRMLLASGSIEKPSSEYKKKEALTVAQAIGQVGQAAPGATLHVILRMFQTAFGTVVNDEDWGMLQQEAQANLMKGTSTNGQPEGQQPQPKPPGARPAAAGV